MASPCPTTGHARPSAIEIKEGCDNLDRQVSRNCVLDIWVDAPESVLQEFNEEVSKAILELEVD